jgi:hypothetical protein
MSSVAAYLAHPARVEARMDQPLSRWLWLVTLLAPEPGGV